MILSRHVYSLFALAQWGSFSKAAQQLYISVPALVQQMNLLEEEVGVALLRRSYKGVELTAAGQAFLKRMQEIARQVEDAQREAQNIARNAVPRIRIAYAQNLQQQYVYRVYRLYAQTHCEGMELIPLPYEQVLRGVIEGEYDGGYVQMGNRARNSGLKTVLLMEQTPSLAIHKKHPLAQRGLVYPEDLSGMEIVLPEQGLHDSADTFRAEVACSQGVHIVEITDLMQSEIYCREHGAARLCLKRVIDPDMVMVPVKTKARFGICLAFRRESETMDKLDGLIRLTEKCCRMGSEFWQESS